MFAIIQSILVYGIMVWIMTYNAKQVINRKYNLVTFKDFITNKNILVSLIVFSILAAIRWDVGADCRTYIISFYHEISEKEIAKGELLYHGIKDFFKNIGLSHVPFFFTLGFIQIIFIYYGLRKTPVALLFLPLAFVLYGTYWSYMNGVRQSIACSIFIFTTLLLSEKKYIWAATWILIAALFHKSAYALLILGPIFYFTRNIFLNKYIQLIVLLVCFAMMGMSIGDKLSSIATNILDFIGYKEGSQEHLLETIFDINFGFRAYLMLFTNIIVILFSNKIRRYFNSTHFNIMYNMYFTGVCLWVLFYGNHGIERFNMYLTCFIPIILSYFIYFLYKNSRIHIHKIALFLVIALLSLRTFYDMYESSDSPYDVINYKTIFFRDIKI